MPRFEFNFDIKEDENNMWYWVCTSNSNRIRFRSYMEYRMKSSAVNSAKELIKKMKPGITKFNYVERLPKLKPRLPKSGGNNEKTD